MLDTTDDQRLDELRRDYEAAETSYDDDLKAADAIKDPTVRLAHKSEINANYFKLKSVYWHAKAVALDKVGEDVDGAFQAAVEARSAIEDATGQERPSGPNQAGQRSRWRRFRSLRQGKELAGRYRHGRLVSQPHSRPHKTSTCGGGLRTGGNKRMARMLFLHGVNNREGPEYRF